MLDNVIVDLSTLRIEPQEMPENDLLSQWKLDIWTAATKAGMILADDIVEDNTFNLDFKHRHEVDGANLVVENIGWTKDSIQNIPALSLGVFEGERTKAKTMVRFLSELWDIPVEVDEAICQGDFSDNSKKSKSIEGKGKFGHNKAKTRSKIKKQRRQKNVDFDPASLL